MNDDLKGGIAVAQETMQLFFQNRFEDAKKKVEEKDSLNMYTALAKLTILYLQAGVTLEVEHIQLAVEAAKEAVEVAHAKRRKRVFGDNFHQYSKESKRSFYTSFSDEQVHAELCYAESLLQKTFLLFLQDENFMVLVKGGLKIRECYQHYKECWRILKYRQWTDQELRITFESGVRMGIGAFNLLMSMLPARVLKLLEFVGFSGNKSFGLKELNLATQFEDGLRAPLARLGLLFYHIFAATMFGLEEDTDIQEGQRLIAPCLQKYGQSALFLFFSARINVIKGELETAELEYQRAVESQREWINLHHLCYWELLWCHAYQAQWLLAMKLAERLSQESRWSKATYLYLKAAFLLQHENEVGQTSDELSRHIVNLLKAIPDLMQRFGGRALPIEKFALKKAKLFAEQENYLVLPALEVIHVWGGFQIIGRRRDLVDKMLMIVEANINDIINKGEKGMKNYHDNYCLALMLKGVCLRYRTQIFQAQMCFTEVLENDKLIKHDRYLLPFVEVELAQMALLDGNWEEGRLRLERAKKHKGYSLESRLHFRMHAFNMHLKAVEKAQQQGKSLPALNGLGSGKLAENSEMDFDQMEQNLEEIDEDEIAVLNEELASNNNHNNNNNNN